MIVYISTFYTLSSARLGIVVVNQQMVVFLQLAKFIKWQKLVCLVFNIVSNSDYK